MNKSFLLNRNVINIGIPLGLLGILIVLMTSSFFNGDKTLSLAISADLLLTVPFVYFLLIRKSKIPKTTVVPVMMLGVIIGSLYLPKESQTYLELFKSWALPVIELSILTFVIFKVRKAIKTYKEVKGKTPDFYDALKNTCYELLPKKMVRPFATEVAVFYYGFVNWRQRTIADNEFTYHKKSGTPALLGAFILAIAAETTALHLLLNEWSPVVAWILTGASIYTAVQVLGFSKALSKRPILVDNEQLTLRYGLLNEAQIPVSDIETVSLSRNGLDKDDKLSKTLSPLGELERYNVVISLKSENILVGLYGAKKKFKTIGLHVDNPNDFIEKLENALQEYAS